MHGAAAYALLDDVVVVVHTGNDPTKAGNEAW
jgi:hypothetical protein